MVYLLGEVWLMTAEKTTGIISKGRRRVFSQILKTSVYNAGHCLKNLTQRYFRGSLKEPFAFDSLSFFFDSSR
jgi:hypothetical protein